MPDGRRRSREHWTDTMEAGPPDPPAHVHRLPPVVRIAAVGLTLAVGLVIVALVLIGLAVYQADQYVKGRGVYRDQENARTNERINRAMCDLLDQLPEGGLLNRPRAKYGCGPGLPIDSLTPQEQAQLHSRTPAAPAPSQPQPLVPLPLPGGADPGVVPPQPGTLPPRTGPGPGGPTPTPPSPEPAAPTASPLSPVTDLVCGLVDVCN